MQAAKRPNFGSALVAGLIAGVAMIYLAMVGIVGTLAERPIVAGIGGEGPGLVTLGRVMLFLPPFLAGFVVANRMHDRATSGTFATLPGAILCGIVAGVVLTGFIVLVGIVDIQDIILPVTPNLLDTLTFDQGPFVGGVLATVIAAVVAALGGGLRLLAPRYRGAVITGLAVVLTLALLEPIIAPILGELDLRDVRDVVFSDGGLGVVAAALVLLLTIGISIGARHPESPVRRRLGEVPDEQRRQLGIAMTVIGIIALLLVPLVSTGFVSLILFNVGLFLMLALGLNIVVGYAGLLDLGYVAFFAVGAYGMGILTSPASSMGGPFSAVLGPEWGFWLALPVVLIITALVGVLIGAPVLRLRGDYLAIVTLGFGEIARVLVGSEALRGFLGGPNGVVGVPSLTIPAIGELTSPGEYYYPVVFFAAFAAYVAWRLSNSRTGRAWNAMREDESVAESTGINTTNYKLLAFALGGTLGGLSGALFAVQLTTVFPGSFLLIVSITVLAIIILGGMGTIRGVIAGAFILVALPDALREFGEYRFLVYGAALVAMMILRPEGLFPSRTRQMELHEEADGSEPQLGESDLDPDRPQTAPGGASAS